MGVSGRGPGVMFATEYVGWAGGGKDSRLRGFLLCVRVLCPRSPATGCVAQSASGVRVNAWAGGSEVIMGGGILSMQLVSGRARV